MEVAGDGGSCLTVHVAFGRLGLVVVEVHAAVLPNLPALVQLSCLLLA